MEFKLNSECLKFVIENEKTVISQVGSFENVKDLVGSEVTVTDDKIKVVKKVVNIVHYDDLETFLKNCWDKVCPGFNSFEEAVQYHQRLCEMETPGVFVFTFSDQMVKTKGGINAFYLD